MWKDLIICGVTPGTGAAEYTHPCGFGDLILLTQNLITNLIVISTLLAGAVFAYAGLLLLTSGGNQSKMEKAKEMLWKVLIGYLWILGAWVLVYTITSVLLKPEFNFILKGGQGN